MRDPQLSGVSLDAALPRNDRIGLFKGLIESAQFFGQVTHYVMSNYPDVTAAIYPNGINIIGGTGRFAAASGNLKLLFGAADFADLKNGNAQFIFRYQGQICFAQPEH